MYLHLQQGSIEEEYHVNATNQDQLIYIVNHMVDNVDVNLMWLVEPVIPVKPVIVVFLTADDDDSPNKYLETSNVIGRTFKTRKTGSLNCAGK